MLALRSTLSHEPLHPISSMTALFCLTRTRALTLIAVWCVLAGPCRANSTIVTAGNALQILMPLGVAGISLAKHDEAGLWQLAKSELATVGITYGLKYGIHSTGPDGQQHSFPSGHTAVTFSAAQFLQERYGWEYGVPAYLLAGLTGYSRVSGDYHYWGEVIGGAAIGMASSYFFTSRFLGQQVSLITTPKLVGIRVQGTW